MVFTMMRCCKICYFISGLIADIDIESEKYRWMGSARLDFYVSMPFYKVHILFIFYFTEYERPKWNLVAIIFFFLLMSNVSD